VGAAGGAYAGHAIEKNQARYTAYVMRIRMDDGSTRTVEQRTALANGAHVVVKGRTARLQAAQRG
jgi:outer membrane lipoprotein SlyB